MTRIKSTISTSTIAGEHNVRAGTQVAFDLDGVLANNEDRLLRFVQLVLGDAVHHKDDGNYRQFDIVGAGISRNQVHKAVDLWTEHASLNSPIYPDALSTIQRLQHRKPDHPICIITSRNFKHADITMEWLHQWMVDIIGQPIPYNLHMVGGTGLTKRDVIENNRSLQIFVDDRYKTVYDLASHRSIVYPVLRSHPHNTGRPESYYKHIVRTGHLSSIFVLLDLIDNFY